MSLQKSFRIFILFSLSLAGCSLIKPAATPTVVEQPTETSTTIPPTATTAPTTEPTPTVAQVDYGPTNFPANVNPLTGLPVNDPTRLDRRPISIKIQIFPRDDRPPFALALADIVYDYYQNNGLTRFNAIFYGNDAEQVGPVRSGRLFDSEIVHMYKAIFAFGGADKRILKTFFNSDFSNRLVLEGAMNCPPMCRVEPNGANYLVANTKEMGPYVVSKGGTNDRQNLDGMKFQFQTPPNGVAGVQIFNRFSISSYNRWDFDQASGRYLRFQDTQEDAGQGEGYAALMDRVTNTQIVADNVVVLLIPHEYAYKSGNSEIVEIKMGDSGIAYAFRDGYAYELKWTRQSPDAIFSLVFPDGTPYSYKPGITFYEVMGTSSNIDKKENGVWRFEIKFP
ncbi:MAG: DUF3048 domain-containing protein [Anaerolineales bacterium]